jgi:drug/metabolite transporter (DMT)-like permease
MAFACNSALASVAYRSGATALSVVTYRTVFGAVVLFVLMHIWQQPLRLPLRSRVAAIGLGLLIAGYSYALLAAVERIPVALAILAFYTYPLMVGVASAVLGHERLTPAVLVALLVSLVGLGLALDIGSGQLDPIGVAFAVGAAALFTVLLLINRRLVGQSDSRAVSFHMMATAAVLYLALDLVLQRFPVPQDTTGLLAFLGVGVFHAFAFITLFIVTSRIGNTRAALIMNTEPITSVFLGTVLLGQSMKLSQLAGAALVIAAIVFTDWRRMKT